MSTEELEGQLDQFRVDFDAVRKQIARVVVGQSDVIESALVALVAGGHVLLEGGPGLGKTLLVRTLADSLDLGFRRIQFTPDLMPADVVGTSVVMESHGRRTFEFQQGPIFTNVLLADEINRATPKTQSALIEGLEEGAVTIANQTYDLPEPFFTMATQSASESEGTFPLPVKQLDRFMFKLRSEFPTGDEMEEILARTTEPEEPVATSVLKGERIVEMSQLARQVLIAPEIRRFAIDTVLATRPEQPTATPMIKRYVSEGCSPRGAQAMILAGKIRAILAGRASVSREDLKQAALPALRHRLSLNFEGHAEQIDPDAILQEVLGSPAAVAKSA
ncbi:MAG: AAA family ATPase [Pirellulaceae bacterium]